MKAARFYGPAISLLCSAGGGGGSDTLVLSLAYLRHLRLGQVTAASPDDS